MSIDYKQAGVDIDTGNAIVGNIKRQVTSTFSANVLTGIGSFGSLFDLKAISQDYQHPILVQSIDGLGTKPIVAKMMGKYDNLGIDIISATVNDIIVLGARPINFLDYIASDKLSPAIVEQLIEGMVMACRQQGISLVGGETAEMPDVYAQNDYDVVGVITGIVEKDNIISGDKISAGDKIYALPSNGLHTNGYSLARKVLFDHAQLDVTDKHDQLGMSIGEALLQPHINYNQPVQHLLSQGVRITGMAHITGGGVIDNIPRILPNDCDAEIDINRCPIPAIFSLTAKLGHIGMIECYRAFNMGIGLVVIGDDSIAQQCPTDIYEIGHIIPGKQQVKLQGV